jgi:hypothetical protein
MSDTNMAPAPAPAPVAPVASEVPINPNPTSAPAPITNTPPPALPSRHEVIERAFERARVERKGAAEAKMGHNQPPEATEKEKPVPPKDAPLNLKKRPVDQASSVAPDQQPAPRERGEHGHFAAKAVEGREQPVPGRGVPPSPGAASYSRPPARMREDAKAEWSRTPESVRRDVHRMHHEFTQAYQRFRADHEVMNELRPYHDLAQSQGTSLPVAVRNFKSIEDKLRTDPIGGLDVIVNNLNLHTEEGRRLTLPDVAYHVLSQTPEQHKLVAAQNQQVAMQHQMAQLQQQQQMLAQQQKQMHYERRFYQERGTVDRFAETNPRLDELADLIKREIDLGFDLPTAYQRANLLRPGGANKPAPAAQTRAPAPQTRTSDRSISGAPGSGVANGVARRGTVNTRRGAVESAFRRFNGSL